VRCDKDDEENRAYGIMSSAIREANFPTLVPPYLCTSHLASGSIVFWCRFGGVLGNGGDSTEDSEADEGVERGVDGADMVLLATVGKDSTVKSVGFILKPRSPCCR
jgi:hypothetical protein